MRNLTATICLTIAVLFDFSLPVFAEDNKDFRPTNCEYTVRFPAIPEVTQVYVPQLGNAPVPTANHLTKNSLLRAECYSEIEIKNLNEKMIREWFFQGASQMGLGGLSFTLEKEVYGSVAKIRGYKTISNNPMTYEMMMYIGENTVLIIYVGSLSSVYPTNEISNFINSVRR